MKRIAFIALWLAIIALMPGLALAQDNTRLFLGQKITRGEGVYLVTKDVNVRAGPKTKSKKLGSARKGSRLNVVGKARGGAGWMAIQRDGKDFGFVYAPVLLPLLDGTLDRDITGRIVMNGRSPCGYTIHFSGRNELINERISFADYEIEYRCSDGDVAYRFYAPMFMTEVPYRQTSDPVFQISIDLLAIDDDPDNMLSIIFLYRRDQNLVVFDSFSKARMGRKPDRPERQARTVAEALAAAAETAPTVWSDATWKKLFKLHRDGG
ncbi:MAG TPA: SH3 domain-containing protein [Rhodospirillales bacterium]|nr:SH3 domain-containing protein [Rhodospirillales bacterium]